MEKYNGTEKCIDPDLSCEECGIKKVVIAWDEMRQDFWKTEYKKINKEEISYDRS